MIFGQVYICLFTNKSIEISFELALIDIGRFLWALILKRIENNRWREK